MEMLKIKNIKKLNINNNQKTPKQEYQNKIKKAFIELNKIIELTSKINIDDKSQILEIDEKIQEISNNLEYYEEIAISSNDEDLKRMSRRLNNKYRELQNNYISRKIILINEKLDNTKLDLNSEYKKTIQDIELTKQEVKRSMEESINETKSTIDNITSNMLFSIAAIFLGTSATSAMVTGLTDLNSQYYLLYFSSILVISVIVIGLSSILIKNDVKKFKEIIYTMIIAFLFWIIIGLMTIFIK